MKRFKSISRTKKIVVIGLAAALTLGVAGTAFAYFTGSASTTTYATVGSAGWSISSVSISAGPIYPGAGSQTVTFNLTNSSGGAQLLDAVSVYATPSTDGHGGVIDYTASNVDGCAASWFTGTYVSGPSAGVTYPTGFVGTYTYSFTMTDSGGNQNACQGLSPQVTISVT